MVDPTPADLKEAVAELLDGPPSEHAPEVLQRRQLLNAAGLELLITEARTCLVTRPADAVTLARACGYAAELAGAASYAPVSIYLEAEVAAMRGNFEVAKDLVERALAGFERLELAGEALRTNLGLIHILNEMGLHRDAIEVGDGVLARLSGSGKLSPEEKSLRGAVLINLGPCYEMLGEFENALEAYSEAEAAFHEQGADDRVAYVANNRGVVLLNIGRAGGAVLAFESAASYAARSGDDLLSAMVLTNLGNAHLLLGDYTSALDELEQAAHLFSTVDPEQLGVLEVDQGNVHLAMNLYPEAVEHYEAALSALDESSTHHRARALWGIGAAITSLGRPGAAREHLERAAAIFEASDNRPMYASVLLELASAVESCGDGELAGILARRALDSVMDSGAVVERIQARFRLADFLLPDTDAAEDVLQAAWREAEGLELVHVRYRLNQRMGRLRRLQGRATEALMHLEAAVEQVERLRAGLVQEALRSSFLRDKSQAYEDLVRLHLDEGTVDGVMRAFAVAEQAKSRSLLELLLEEVVARVETEADDETAARLKVIRANLDAIYNQWLGGSGLDAQRGVAIPELAAQAATLERTLSRMTARNTPARGPGEHTAVVLPPDTMLVEYFVTDGQFTAFLHDGRDIAVARDVASVEEVDWHLRHFRIQLDRLGAGRWLADRHATTLEAACRRVLAELYQLLFAPVVDRFGRPPAADGRRIVVVPHASLHHVPFHALVDERGYLVEQWQFSYAPSASILRLCLERTPRPPRRAFVVGVTDPTIPAAQEEVTRVARHFPEAELVVGANASREALFEVGRVDQIHLASHGLFRSDNPMFSALRLADGWVTAAELAQMKLDGMRVTLSACESGRHEIGGGDEVLGLTRGILQAGASSVTASMWLVQDETTPQMMDAYYRQLLAGDGPAKALRVAQLESMSDHPHPYYWAPFVVVGSP